MSLKHKAFHTGFTPQVFDNEEFDIRTPEDWLSLGCEEGSAERKPVPAKALLPRDGTPNGTVPRSPSRLLGTPFCCCVGTFPSFLGYPSHCTSQPFTFLSLAPSSLLSRRAGGRKGRSVNLSSRPAASLTPRL